MKTSRFSNSQILAILSQASNGVPLTELCREHGMSSAALYKWRARYGVDASMMARMKELERENARPQNRIRVTSEHPQACQAFRVSECCYRYERKLSEDNACIAGFLLCLTQSQRNWGFGLCFLYPRNVKDHKRVYRIYRELELNLRIRPRKRLKRDKPETLAVPDAMNQVWSMDSCTSSCKTVAAYGF